MNKADPILGYIGDLAKFANLKPEGVEEFKKLNFLPPEAWPGMPAVVLAPHTLPNSEEVFLWQTFQDLVRDLWRGFSFEQCLQLVVSIDRFSQQTKRLEQLFQQPNEEIQKLIDEGPPRAETWPIQKAIWFLSVNPWRARYCEVCGQPFAIITPNNNRRQRHCSTACRDEAATRRKHKWGKKNNWGRK